MIFSERYLTAAGDRDFFKKRNPNLQKNNLRKITVVHVPVNNTYKTA
jgi:hypothetical protein